MNPKIEKDTHSHGTWVFTAQKSILTHSMEISKISDDLQLQNVPELFFDKNTFSLQHPSVSININCQDSLRLCNFTYLDEMLSTCDPLTKVYLRPGQVHLKQYAQWK